MTVTQHGTHGRSSRNAAFSMVEIMIVIGIIGILIGVGAMSYVAQIKAARVESATRMIEANFRQARQECIAKRRDLRVVIDAGALEGFPDEMNGPRTRRAATWIEGKYLNQYDFEAAVHVAGSRDLVVNTIELTDPEYLPDAVMVGDLDGRTPGVGNPEVFYIEFNTRGSISNVYFEGEETSTNYNEIAPIIHLTRDGEVFLVGGNSYDYADVIKRADTNNFQWGKDAAIERYKVTTLEVIRLTGRVRRYGYAIMSPWLLDEPAEESE